MSASSTASTASYTSTTSSGPAPTHPISIGFTPAMSIATSPRRGSSSPPFRPCGMGAAYISDEDLFALDNECLDGGLPFLNEAPPTPRGAADYAEMLWAAPVVQQQQPLPALGKPKAMPARKGRKASNLKRTKGLSCVREAAME